MTDYIVTRTVPSLQMARVDVDNREWWDDGWWYWRGWFGRPVYIVETHCPQTTRARLWRWVLGG